MALRLSIENKKEILEDFVNGIAINELALKFNCTKLTISRNLKKSLGDEKYKNLIEANKSERKFSEKENNHNEVLFNRNLNNNQLSNITYQQDNYESDSYQDNLFMELAPLDYEINKETQKDLSSVPLSTINFPKTVYMIVDKKIELEIKLLRDFPEWHFLPEEDLNRKTIQIFYDINNAKKNCNKDKKVIKVPNTEVFKIASKILLSRGISRIVNEDQLIAI
ncbi:conserved hypothetical protein [Prochlorococcus marinus str. MIT 9301]|uniref:Uncharacterized protein n=1 Tax=Prochlorococcus marinus (strain MIT 9301) TaxID=167546 RepID=A3PE44_PROM0|nr:hypothetical protein [Prochlorococcus marinus]ABO18019.1 conserved hypothetical protein [Prochlorococcus marinus str. MIT 9301]